MKITRQLAVGLALAMASFASRAADAYVFAYFTGNGEDGLHFAGSADGYLSLIHISEPTRPY